MLSLVVGFSGIRFVETVRIDAYTVSYGTMECLPVHVPMLPLTRSLAVRKQVKASKSIQTHNCPA